MFTVNSKDLALVLAQCKPLCARKTSIAASSYFSLVTLEDAIQIQATDLENTITLTIHVADISRQLSVLLPLDKVLSIAETSKGSIQIAENGNLIEIKSATTQFTINKAFNFEDFPVNPYDKIAAEKWYPVASKELIKAINCVTVTAFPGDVRAHIAGARIVAQDNAIHFHGTDSARLHVISISAPGTLEESALPAKSGLKALLPFLKQHEAVEIGFSEKTLMFKAETSLACVRCLEGAFPDIYSMLDTARSYPRMLVGSKELNSLMKRMTTFDTSRVIINSAGSALILETKHDFIGQIQETFKVEGHDLKFEDLAINPKFITDAIQFSDEYVIIGYKDSKSPLYINGDIEALIMPIQI